MIGPWSKIAVFTDLHLGKKGDSRVHNEDCLEYVGWFIDRALSEGCDTVLCMGDWNDCRSRIRVDTLDYGQRAAESLALPGWQVLMITGNHDLFYRDRRLIHSLPRLNLPNYHIVDSPAMVGDTLFCPWLCSKAEMLAVAQHSPRYVFGHFEFPGFMMNARAESVDRGMITADWWERAPEHIFSGHFHQRQSRRASGGSWVHYIGNCFPHDFNDVGETERGMMVLERDGGPRYIDWDRGPTYHRVLLSELLDPESLGLYNERATIRAVQDVPLEYEERLELMTEMVKIHRVREFTLETMAAEQAPEQELRQEGVEQVVIEHIRSANLAGTHLDAGVLEALFLEARLE